MLKHKTCLTFCQEAGLGLKDLAAVEIEEFG